MALKTIRLQLRFLVPLTIALIGASYLAVPLMDRVTLRWFSRDLNSRGKLVANALSDSVAEALQPKGSVKLRALFDRTAQDERLFAIGLCTPEGQLLQSTERFPSSLSCAGAVEVAQRPEPRLALPGGAVHVGVQDVMGHRPAPPVFTMAAAASDPLPTTGPPDPIDAMPVTAEQRPRQVE